MPISPTLISRTTTVDACATTLRSAILTGDLAAGERLPPERELAARFGVNRVTVRSALGRLASEGLLSVRQGSGHVVRDFVAEGGPQLLPELAELARESGDLLTLAEDLLLVRRSLARGVLERLATRRPSKAVRKTMSGAIDALEAAVKAGDGTAALAELDIAVIAELVAAAGSSALRLFMNPVQRVLRELPELRDAIYADAPASVVAHRAVLAWLERPSPNEVPAFIAILEERDKETLARVRRQRGPAPGRREETKSRVA